MKKVTLKDIANELNVTVGTVSHVINGIDDISEETKNRVLETARKMGYIANGPAASLRSGKTNTVAVIVPDISNPHIAYQIKLIEDRLKELGYSIIILNTDEDENVEYRAITAALSKQVDGILLCPCQLSTKNTRFLKKHEVPFVLIGRFYEQLETDYVCADDFKGGCLAGQLLVQKNCKNPLYVGAYSYIQSSTNRYKGLKASLAENNIHIADDRFIQVSPKLDSAKNIIKELYENNVEFDSVVAFSDIIAYEIIYYVKKYYKKDIPVIGFDAISSHMFMPFSNISIGMVEKGWANKAAEIITEKIKGSKKTYKELIDVKVYESDFN